MWNMKFLFVWSSLNVLIHLEAMFVKSEASEQALFKDTSMRAEQSEHS